MNDLFDKTMEHLKKCMKARGSIRSICEALDLNPSTVSRWFAEGRSPDFRGLTAIFEYLGIEIKFPDEQQISTPLPKENISIIEKETQDLREQLGDKDRQLAEKDKQIEALAEEIKAYKYKWEGFLEVKEREMRMLVEAQVAGESKKKLENELLFIDKLKLKENDNHLQK